MSCAKSQYGLYHPLTRGDEVNFRLTYDGPLKAASQSDCRRLEKHAIRRVFSNQLLYLLYHKEGLLDKELDTIERKALEHSEFGKFYFTRGEWLFLAIVRERLHLVCDLDILFLRREPPGQLVSGGGDIDNRIKVLFDALRVPQDENELRGCGPEKTMACLTEDDKLITGFRVTTDRLLEPPASPSNVNDVRLIINVEVKPTKLTTENMAYFSHF